MFGTDRNGIRAETEKFRSRTPRFDKGPNEYTAGNWSRLKHRAMHPTKCRHLHCKEINIFASYISEVRYTCRFIIHLYTNKIALYYTLLKTTH